MSPPPVVLLLKQQEVAFLWYLFVSLASGEGATGELWSISPDTSWRYLVVRFRFCLWHEEQSFGCGWVNMAAVGTTPSPYRHVWGWKGPTRPLRQCRNPGQSTMSQCTDREHQ